MSRFLFVPPQDMPGHALAARAALGVLVIVSLALAACAPVSGAPRECSTVRVSYVGTAPGEQGGNVGVFSVANAGNVALELPLEWQSQRDVHSQYADVQMRPFAGGEWRVANPVLAEVAGWEARIAIAPGEAVTVTYHANGLFDAGPVPGMEYAVTFRDLAGCTYRSGSFTW